MTRAVLRPRHTPSLLMKKMATLVPPTEEGVMAEVNSHNIMMLKDLRHESTLPERMRSRIM